VEHIEALPTNIQKYVDFIEYVDTWAKLYMVYINFFEGMGNNLNMIMWAFLFHWSNFNYRSNPSMREKANSIEKSASMKM
jgi:hypothetical protein